MGTVTSNVDYAHDSSGYSGPNFITDSEKLRSQLRERCNMVLSRLFPEHGESALGDWNKNDVFELTALFELARAFRHAETDKPLLNKHTILRVLNKLTMGSLFQDHGSTSLIEKEQHLRLLSAALRLYKYEGTTLAHDRHAALYRGFNEIRASFEDDRKTSASDQQIENHNVAFLIQHCQYLLVSIEDDESLSKAVVKRLGLAVDAGLSAWGSQLVDAKQNVRDIAKRQRSRPKWHDEYMRLEDISFTMYMRSLGLEVKLPTMNTETEINEDELNAALVLRDSMEDTLIEEPKKMYKFIEKLHTGLGKMSQILSDCGSYEENTEYFRYGVLDLMYQLSYRIHSREQCFPEFVGIIKLVLERSHPSATLLHRKAIDLYRRINELGREDYTTYGTPEDRRKIESWKYHHRREVDSPTVFEKRSKRYRDEISKVREKGKFMLRLEPQTQAPRATPLIRQQTLRSEIFPPTPNHVPGYARKPPSPIMDSDILEDPFCASPEPGLSLDDDFNDETENDAAFLARVAEFMKKDGNWERVMNYPRQPLASSPGLSPQVSPRVSPRMVPQDSYPPETSQSQVHPPQRQDTLISATSASSTVRADSGHIPIGNSSSSVRPRGYHRNLTITTITPPDHDLNNLRRYSTLPVHPPAVNVHSNDRASLGASMVELEPTPGSSPPHQPSSTSVLSRPTIATQTSGRTPQTPQSSFINLARRETSNTTADRQASLFAHTGLAERHAPSNLMTGPDFKSRTKDRIDFTAVSATGCTVAVVAKQRFWVFVTTQISLACSGIFEKRKNYKYASGEGTPQNQHPMPNKFSVSSFSSIALSDEYLAIGTTEKVMVFAVTGEHSGRWVVCDDIPRSEITKLAFSPDGKQLVALVVKQERNSYDSARIYSTNLFVPRERAQILQTEALGANEIQWQDFVHKASGIAFSQNGEMIVICTTHCSGKAEIRILKKEVATWRNWGTREVTVHLADHREWHGGGLTGISFFRNDEFLVLSVDSSNPRAGDCYQISKERTVFKLDRCENIAKGERGTTNLHVAVSQPYDAVALLNKEGSLQIKLEGELLGSVAKHPTVKPHDPITISFDESGTKLIFLDHNGHLEIYQIYENRLGPRKPTSLIL